MSLPDRRPVSTVTPSAASVPAALRQDGAAPRSPVERLLMLCMLAAICLAVAIPTVVVSWFFGQRPRPKMPAAAVQATPVPGDGLLERLQQSAGKLLPDAQSLGPDPIIVPVRPGHVAARLETVRRQVARFGGTATEGLPDGNEKHLFVDLPAAATAAFRVAVLANSPVDAASPAPSATAFPAASAGSPDHVEVIIRPAGDDE